MLDAVQDCNNTEMGMVGSMLQGKTVVVAKILQVAVAVEIASVVIHAVEFQIDLASLEFAGCFVVPSSVADQLFVG